MRLPAFLTSLLLVGLGISFGCWQSAQAQIAQAQTAQVQSGAGTRLRAYLTDGSQLLGTTANESIKLQLDIGSIEIPFGKLRRIELKPQERTARVELGNSDTLTGRIEGDTLPFETLIGKFDLSWKHLKSLERIPPDARGSLPVRKGLVAYYSFDHGQEGLGVDDASEKYKAEVKDAKWIEAGKRGGAVEFNGSAMLTVPHADALNVIKGLTFSAWVNPNEDYAGYAMIAGKTRGSSWSGGYGLARMSGDAENVYFFVNSYTTSVVKAPIKKGEWSHVVGVCDEKSVQIFINGKLAQSIPLTLEVLSGTDVILPVDMPLMFGSDQAGNFWKGKLDEAALFDRALSEEEIVRLYEAGAQTLVAK